MYVFFKVSIHVQQTTQLKHYAAYNTEEGETTDWQQTAEERENERQRDAKMNWNSWHGSPGTRSWKSYQTSENKHLFKYINIYNSVYQRYTGPEKERKQRETGIKHGCGELKKRNAVTEDYWSRRELQKLNAKEKNGSGNTKNRKCRNDIRTPRKNEEKYAEYRYKRKIPVYSWIHKDQLKAMENKNKRKQLINNILYIHIITY